MFTSGPPEGGLPAAPLVVRTVAHRTFEDPSPLAGDPEHTARHQEYLADMVRPYGLTTLGLAGTPDGLGQSFGEMAAAVITEAVPANERVDLLVLAFAGPDLTPGRATATYLSHVCPGAPLAFAICDQGSATAFTGLRLIDEYTRSGAARSALLIVVEQAGLHHPPAAPAAVTTRHTAVALQCDRADAGDDATIAPLRQYTDVAPDRVGALLATELADPAVGRDVTLILGAQLAAAVRDLPVAVRTKVADPGRPHTGVWWELAAELATDPGVRRIVLADHDPQLGYLCLSVVDARAAVRAAVAVGTRR